MLKFFSENAELDDWADFDEEDEAIDNTEAFYNDMNGFKTEARCQT